ncbi:hypothetical protein C8R45DRAFT_356508 [Mycena sanguinolenta]|nr:hypothetical protein C8R45DRAFT_356508 [Mycena sanguinolenta]
MSFASSHTLFGKQTDAASPSAQDDERAPTSPPFETRDNDNTFNNGSGIGGREGAHAGSAFANGSRITHDARDALAGGKLPKLTLMEEVFLLGFKDGGEKMGLGSIC